MVKLKVGVTMSLDVPRKEVEPRWSWCEPSELNKPMKLEATKLAKHNKLQYVCSRIQRSKYAIICTSLIAGSFVLIWVTGMSLRRGLFGPNRQNAFLYITCEMASNSREQSPQLCMTLSLNIT